MYIILSERFPPEKTLAPDIENQVEIQVKYEGYILKQTEMAEKLKKMEGKKIPDNFDYSSINGLSTEVLEKLRKIMPANIGQAGRIPGITPAALSLLLISIEKEKDKESLNLKAYENRKKIQCHKSDNHCSFRSSICCFLLSCPSLV